MELQLIEKLHKTHIPNRTTSSKQYTLCINTGNNAQ